MGAIGNELITVIVPVYNAEMYLEQCVYSILNQTYKNLQILLVDDGSSDTSFEICKDFQKKDARIEAIHQDNKGSSAARNTGLDKAEGRYIYFVDADDFIEETAIEELFICLLENDVEIAMSNASEFTEKGRARTTESAVEGVISGAQVLNMPGQKDAWLYVAVWNKLFDRKVFRELRFPDGLSFEDEYIFHEIFNINYKVVGLKKSLYNYRINENGMTKKKFNIKKVDIVEGYFHRFQYLTSLQQSLFSVDKLNINHQLLHIETAGFQYLQNAFCSLPHSEKKEKALWDRITMDRAMVDELIRRNVISKKSKWKRKLFYMFPNFASHIAQLIKNRMNMAD